MSTKIFPLMMAIAAGVGAMSGGSATAAQLGLYVGGSYGEAEKDAVKAPFDAFALELFDEFTYFPSEASSRLNTKDSSYGFLVGYRLLPHLAIEGSYMDLGEVGYRVTSVGSIEGEPINLNINVDTITSGVALSALGILPLSYRWEIYGRAGVLFASNEFSVFISQIGRGSFTESSTDFFAGVGGSFSFAEIYALRFEYQRVFDAGDDEVLEGDVDLISLGITVSF